MDEKKKLEEALEVYNYWYTISYNRNIKYEEHLKEIRKEVEKLKPMLTNEECLKIVEKIAMISEINYSKP